MLRSLATRMATGRAARAVPFLKWLALAEIAVLARRHVAHLDAEERRELARLLRRGRALPPADRDRLRVLVAKMEPRAFLGGAADRLSPVPIPRRLSKARY
jgi:hypothetical protein